MLRKGAAARDRPEARGGGWPPRRVARAGRVFARKAEALGRMRADLGVDAAEVEDGVLVAGLARHFLGCRVAAGRGVADRRARGLRREVGLACAGQRRRPSTAWAT